MVQMASSGEQQYTVQGVQQDLRADGRGREDFRPTSLDVGIIEQATGSARLQIGATDVLVAVKAEIGEPSEVAPNCGRINVQVEMSACASPEFEGRGSDEIGSELAATLARSVAAGADGKGALDFTALGIVPKRQCWVLHVDGLVLNDDGAILDALSMGMRAALADAKIPSVKVLQATPDADPEVEVNDEETLALDLSNFPITITVSQFGGHYALDCTKAEELCASAAMQIAVNSRGNVLGTVKVGTMALNPGSLLEMLAIARSTAPGIISNHDSILAAAEDEMEEDE